MCHEAPLVPQERRPAFRRGPAYNRSMRWQPGLQLALMWGIRYAPVPWALKRTLIRLATPRPLVVGTALIPDGDGRVLMLRARYSGRWIPPGGAIHPGEDPLTGTVRECREELGQEICAPRLVGLYTLAGTRELFVVFRCAPLAAPPRLSAEHEVYRYTPRAELPWWLAAVAADAWDGAEKPAVVRTLLNWS